MTRQQKRAAARRAAKSPSQHDPVPADRGGKPTNRHEKRTAIARARIAWRKAVKS